MGIQTFGSLKEAARAIARDSKKREARVRKCLRAAALETKRYIAAETIPIAFRELVESLEVLETPNGYEVRASAPHAAAVENGSRPHMPPLEPLIAWVTLRGLSGLTSTGGVRSNRVKYAGGSLVKNRNLEAARVIAMQLRGKLGREGAAKWHSRAAMGPLARRELGDHPETVKIARAIQMAIAKRGTKPSRYMARAIPAAKAFLGILVDAALPDRT